MNYRPSINYSGGASDSHGSTTPQMTPQQLMGMYTQGLPSALATTGSMAPATATTLANAAAGANPIYSLSNLGQLTSMAPAYAQSGNMLAQQQAAANVGLMGGQGGMLALESAGLNNLLNPAQAANNTQAQNLVNSVNMNGLAPGEQNSVERSLNQTNQGTGNLGLNNATNSVSNALNFGGAFNSKLGILGNALGASTGVANAQNQQFNPVNIAQNAGNTSSNFGLTQFNPNLANSTLTTPFSFGSSFGNQLASLGSASKGTTSSGSAQGGLCFLTTACCEYKGLPDDCDELETLRRFRDEAVPATVVAEYYRIAPAIAARLREDKQKLEWTWQQIKQCVADVKDGCYMAAMIRYHDMVKELA